MSAPVISSLCVVMAVSTSPWVTKRVLWRSGRLVLEEGEGHRGKQRRGADVVVGQARQDRECVTTRRPALAHPATVALSATEQLENLDVVARRSHVGVGGDDHGGDLEGADLVREVEVLRH